MLGQHLCVGAGVRFERRPHGRPQFGMGQGGAEGAVQYLPPRRAESRAGGHVLPPLQIDRVQLRPAQALGRRHPLHGRRHVIGRPVGIVAGAGEGDDAPEQRLVVARHHAQRFEIGGAGGLHVEASLGGARQRRIHRQLVRPGVQRQLVRAEVAGDGEVPAQRSLQRRAVALVVDPFLEVAGVARRQRYQRDAAAPALVGDDVVLDQGGRLLGLVDGELDLVIAAGVAGADHLRQVSGAVQGRPVLDRAAQAGLLGELQRQVARQRDRAVVGYPVDLVANRRVALAQGRLVVAVGVFVHGVRWIDREEAESRRGRHRHVVRGLEMVGVRPGRTVPAGLRHAGQRVGHHACGRAPGALHLADRLLRKDRPDRPAGRAQCLHVARRRQADAVAEAEAGGESERDRLAVAAVFMVHTQPSV